MAETFNPSDKAAATVLSNGNLTATTTSAAYAGVRNDTGQGAGKKIYFEMTINSLGGTTALIIGMATSGLALTTACGYDGGGDSCGYSLFTGGFVFQGASTTASLGTLTVGSVIGVALDYNNDNMWMVGPSGNWDGSGTDNPATNTGGLNGSAFFHGNLTAGMFAANLFACVSVYNNSEVTANFGATSFTYAIPSGFSSLFNEAISGTSSSFSSNTGVVAESNAISGTSSSFASNTGVLSGSGGASGGGAFAVIMA
jgi:hypothetical protein